MDTDNSKYWPVNYRPEKDKCIHRIDGRTDWQENACPYCELEELKRQQELATSFYKVAIKERDYERAVNHQLRIRIAQLEKEGDGWTPEFLDRWEGK